MLDLCLDPSDSYLAAVAVDIGGGLEGSVSSSVRLYEVGRQRPAAGDEDDESDGAGETRLNTTVLSTLVCRDLVGCQHPFSGCGHASPLLWWPIHWLCLSYWLPCWLQS